jgi:hypothetical protein
MTLTSGYVFSTDSIRNYLNARRTRIQQELAAKTEISDRQPAISRLWDSSGWGKCRGAQKGNTISSPV